MKSDIRIGEMIDKYMRKNNLTMKQLANKIGRTESAVSLWISGKAMPRMGVVQKMADLFGLTTDQMIFGDDVFDKSKTSTKIQFKDGRTITLEELEKDELFKKLPDILIILSKLNREGRDKVIDFANDLTEIEKYKKQDD